MDDAVSGSIFISRLRDLAERRRLLAVHAIAHRAHHLAATAATARTPDAPGDTPSSDADPLPPPRRAPDRSTRPAQASSSPFGALDLAVQLRRDVRAARARYAVPPLPGQHADDDPPGVSAAVSDADEAAGVDSGLHPGLLLREIANEALSACSVPPALAQLYFDYEAQALFGSNAQDAASSLAERLAQCDALCPSEVSAPQNARCCGSGMEQECFSPHPRGEETRILPVSETREQNEKNEEPVNESLPSPLPSANTRTRSSKLASISPSGSSTRVASRRWGSPYPCSLGFNVHATYPTALESLQQATRDYNTTIFAAKSTTTSHHAVCRSFETRPGSRASHMPFSETGLFRVQRRRASQDAQSFPTSRFDYHCCAGVAERRDIAPISGECVRSPQTRLLHRTALGQACELSSTLRTRTTSKAPPAVMYRLAWPLRTPEPADGQVMNEWNELLGAERRLLVCFSSAPASGGYRAAISGKAVDTAWSPSEAAAAGLSSNSSSFVAQWAPVRKSALPSKPNARHCGVMQSGTMQRRTYYRGRLNEALERRAPVAQWAHDVTASGDIGRGRVTQFSSTRAHAGEVVDDASDTHKRYQHGARGCGFAYGCFRITVARFAGELSGLDARDECVAVRKYDFQRRTNYGFRALPRADLARAPCFERNAGGGGAGNVDSASVETAGKKRLAGRVPVEWLTPALRLLVENDAKRGRAGGFFRGRRAVEPRAWMDERLWWRSGGETGTGTRPWSKWGGAMELDAFRGVYVGEELDNAGESVVCSIGADGRLRRAIVEEQ